MLEALIIAILALISLILFILYISIRKKLDLLIQQHKELSHEYISKSVKHGQHWEQFIPFTKEFEKVASRENFTFIGQPIDGISFDDDNIKFIEFKTGSSSLNNKRKHVKELILNKKVTWHEIRF